MVLVNVCALFLTKGSNQDFRKHCRGRLIIRRSRAGWP